MIDNSNIKKERLWKDGLHLNPSSKDLLTNNLSRDMNSFLRNSRNCDALSGKISSNSSAQKYNKANCKIEECADGSEEASTDSLNQSDKQQTSLDRINEVKIGLKKMNKNSLNKLIGHLSIKFYKE